MRSPQSRFGISESISPQSISAMILPLTVPLKLSTLPPDFMICRVIGELIGSLQYLLYYAHFLLFCCWSTKKHGAVPRFLLGFENIAIGFHKSYQGSPLLSNFLQKLSNPSCPPSLSSHIFTINIKKSLTTKLNVVEDLFTWKNSFIMFLLP